MNNEAEQQKEVSLENSPHQLSVLKGGHGLPVTFWVWGVMGSFFLGFIISAVVSISEALPSLMLCMIAFELYSTFVLVATWRSAALFAGGSHWAVLARAAVTIWYAMVSVAFLYLMAVLNSPYPNH